MNDSQGYRNFVWAPHKFTVLKYYISITDCGK